jgi:hypothetical protein
VLCSLTLPLPLPRLTCTVYIDASRKPLWWCDVFPFISSPFVLSFHCVYF